MRVLREDKEDFERLRVRASRSGRIQPQWEYFARIVAAAKRATRGR